LDRWFFAFIKSIYQPTLLLEKETIPEIFNYTALCMSIIHKLITNRFASLSTKFLDASANKPNKPSAKIPFNMSCHCFPNLPNASTKLFRQTIPRFANSSSSQDPAFAVHIEMKIENKDPKPNFPNKKRRSSSTSAPDKFR
jgi:hypothetical protein